MQTYILTISLSFLLSLAITPLVIAWARKLGVVDRPNARSAHKKPVARAGGVAIFVACMPVVVGILAVPNAIGESFREIWPQVTVLLAGASVMFAVGLLDDVFNLRARYKLVVQVLAAVAACAVGIRIEVVEVRDLFTIDFGIYSWPLTLVWIVGVTNAVNLIDGLDGLAAGISAIACGVIAVLSVFFGNAVMTVIMLSLMGSLTGFLFFNFNPARVFMGDCGSLFLGYMLATASVMCSVKSQALVGLALPILALGVPIFDTFFAMLRRFLERRSMFAPDKGHFHHRLQELGLHQRHVVMIAYAVTIAVAALGCFMMATRSLASIVLFIALLAMIVFIFRWVGSVRLRETISGLRQKYSLAQRIKSEIRGFEDVQLHFRNATTFDQWWESVCLAAEQMDFSSISMPLSSRDGTQRILSWHSKSNNVRKDDLISMVVPIKDRRSDSPLRLDIVLHTNGCLESAGRRVTLFGRLMQENGPKTLSGDRDLGDRQAKLA
ncbi:putative undecaprenyl-phosphate N-acetylglucosaminyl 1-phosphate transferase [Anaerohalosphaera lusitana]|uniref:Putative undecaprenyl-phosphate N-acetylglucosaminyl 1-phosphate transferase n=1 Tax=Anaerohalosphaera lusitana TaxID=1936003 RepID=A0A1U9NKS0_9BACT|nr:MraY family glycosyltransferase [Anaerohalosphaera lusitana]AQT68324.1 putative undecaprenyl-phosphate N-acetylglucosaminyl 1-phosphate transferase [Anaerohalosphaera lusitana]